MYKSQMATTSCGSGLEIITFGKIFRVLFANCAHLFTILGRAPTSLTIFKSCWSIFNNMLAWANECSLVVEAELSTFVILINFIMLQV